ncbi:MAG TPA: helix-turn-helix domain-containing protein [Microbacteriaceae bacterium]|nr:helix-turn-helix domain-containing protein [Microbacteriaceae bacterium]
MSPAIADARRESILRAAMTLISERGTTAFTVGDVAKATGFSRPAVYQYFRSREDILGELLVNDMADLSNEIDRLVATENEPMEQIRVWVHYALAHLASPEHRVVREISAAELDERHRGELRAMHGYLMTSLISPLRQLGAADPAALVHMVFAAVGSASDRISEGASFVTEAATLERFVISGIEAITVHGRSMGEA